MGERQTLRSLVSRRERALASRYVRAHWCDGYIIPKSFTHSTHILTHSHTFPHIPTHAHVGESTHTCTITCTVLGSIPGTGGLIRALGDWYQEIPSLHSHRIPPMPMVALRLSGGRAQADHQAGAKPGKPGHLYTGQTMSLIMRNVLIVKSS